MGVGKIQFPPYSLHYSPKTIVYFVAYMTQTINQINFTIMKNLIAVFSLLFALVSLAQAQDKKPPVSPKLTVESPDKNIKIVYGQPSKKGRVIFGPEGSASLEKYGKVWRTGANEATEITFKSDVMFGGKMVKAGTYTLFTIPGEKEWSVLLNSTLGQWGAYDYEKVKGNDVAMIKVPVSMAKTPIEKLTITPSNSSIAIAWDNMTISVPVMKHGS
jgi:hypothetical protein